MVTKDSSTTRTSMIYCRMFNVREYLGWLFGYVWRSRFSNLARHVWRSMFVRKSLYLASFILANLSETRVIKFSWKLSIRQQQRTMVYVFYTFSIHFHICYCHQEPCVPLLSSYSNRWLNGDSLKSRLWYIKEQWCTYFTSLCYTSASVISVTRSHRECIYCGVLSV